MDKVVVRSSAVGPATVRGPGCWQRCIDWRVPLGGRAEASPSLLVIDSSLARGASNGGATFHVKGVSYGRMGRNAKGAVDVTGLPVAALVVAERQCTRTRQALY